MPWFRCCESYIQNLMKKHQIIFHKNHQNTHISLNVEIHLITCLHVAEYNYFFDLGPTKHVVQHRDLIINI